MLPNFSGCFEYHPNTNPLRGLTNVEKNDCCFAYMKMWYDLEKFIDFNIMYDAGQEGMCADWLVSAGAINSDMCYENCREIEEKIESWANEYRGLSLKKRRKQFNEVFKNSTSFRCKDCNYVSVVNDGNEKLYEQELKACWDCESKNLIVFKLGEK